MNQENKIESHAQLWVGPSNTIAAHAEAFLQQNLCPQGGCNTCATCKNIRKKSHHSIMWLSPEKNYALEDLNCIFETISFCLNSGEKFFFVLEKADFLTPACSNRLLKPLEEPPEGYFFILLSERGDSILPTIKSRCVTKTFGTDHNEINSNPIYKIFTQNLQNTPPDYFLQTLDKNTPNEMESRNLLDSIIFYWNSQYKKSLATAQPNNQIKSIIDLLMAAAEKPPMPGSSKIFWRNLFLTILTTK